MPDDPIKYALDTIDRLAIQARQKPNGSMDGVWSAAVGGLPIGLFNANLAQLQEAYYAAEEWFVAQGAKSGR